MQFGAADQKHFMEAMGTLWVKPPQRPAFPVVAQGCTANCCMFHDNKPLNLMTLMTPLLVSCGGVGGGRLSRRTLILYLSSRSRGRRLLNCWPPYRQVSLVFCLIHLLLLFFLASKLMPDTLILSERHNRMPDVDSTASQKNVAFQLVVN